MTLSDDAGELRSPHENNSLADSPSAPHSFSLPNHCSSNRSVGLARKLCDIPQLPLILLLCATGVFYMWRIGINGVSNVYYSAALWSGSVNWKAWFFGALDPHGIITVDKPPLALWWMGLWAHIFGYSYTHTLIPQAVLAVITVGVFYVLMNSATSRWVATLSGIIIAITPVTAIIYRHNNPDAMLCTLLTCAVLCCFRALPHASYGYLGLAGIFFGATFLTKNLAAFVILPAIGIFFLIFANAPRRKKILALAVGFASLIASLGWYILIVDAIPADRRPYIGGSHNNSLFNLTFGYNGMQRLLENPLQHSAIPDKPVFGGGESSPSVYRLLTNEFGIDIGWFLITALVAMSYLIYVTWDYPNDDQRKSLVWLLTAWFIPFVIVFSAMHGMIHPYYTVMIVPPISGLVSMALYTSWHKRYTRTGAGVLCLLILTSAITGFTLMHRTAQWFPSVQILVLISALSAIALLAAMYIWPKSRSQMTSYVLSGFIVLSMLLGATWYSLGVINRPTSSALPSASPDPTSLLDPMDTRYYHFIPPQEGLKLLTDAHTVWSAATPGALTGADWEIYSRTPVMCIGGFLGIDPVPSLAKFQDYVFLQKIRYYIADSNSIRIIKATVDPHYSADSANITATALSIDNWVKKTFVPIQVGKYTFYDLFRYQ